MFCCASERRHYCHCQPQSHAATLERCHWRKHQTLACTQNSSDILGLGSNWYTCCLRRKRQISDGKLAALMPPAGLTAHRCLMPIRVTVHIASKGIEELFTSLSSTLINSSCSCFRVLMTPTSVFGTFAHRPAWPS